MRWFNTAGPCKPELHYMLPPLERLPRVQRIIAQQGYFVIHAPRQVDDIEFVQDLGLCTMHPQGGLAIANPIYREVLPRVLTLR